MFCTVDPVLDQLCTFCGKSKHTAECCRAHKKAEKKARAQESGAARSNMSNPLMTTTQQTGALLLQPLVQQDPTLEDNNLLKWCPH